MIRIRFLTAESLAGLLVKTAEEQTATRLPCPRKFKEQQPKTCRHGKISQKKDGPEKQVRPFVSLS